MALPEPLIPQDILKGMSQTLEKLARASQESTVATMTAAIVTARGKPTSIKEMLDISNDIRHVLFGDPRTTLYREWAKTRDAALAKIYD